MAFETRYSRRPEGGKRKVIPAITQWRRQAGTTRVGLRVSGCVWRSESDPNMFVVGEGDEGGAAFSAMGTDQMTTTGEEWMRRSTRV